jgi:hypothetical protein
VEVKKRVWGNMECFGCESEMNSIKMSKKRQIQNVRKPQGIYPSVRSMVKTGGLRKK